MSWWDGTVAGIAVALLTLAITWPLARTLVTVGLVDRPNHRSMHTGPVPRGGGAGAVVAMTGVTLLCVVAGLDERVLIILALSLGLAVVGFLDDRLNLAFTPRLIAQSAVAIAAIAIVRDPAMSDVTSWPIVPTAIVTAVWILGCCNAVNFMDGINGITGLHILVFGIHLMVISHDDELVWLPALLAVGAALGFLYWNAIRGKVFLGDGGAYFVGTLFALLVIVAAIRGSTPIVAAAPFAVYAADTSSTIARRVVRRVDLTRGHREHVYQRLTLAGHSHLTIAAFTATCSAACSAAAIAVDRSWAAPGVGVAIVVTVLFAYLTAMRWFPSPPGSATRSRRPVAETTGR